MIWVRGEVVPDDALAISVLDRTFEHGLGLFETLRTWDGRPTLLGRHRERMSGWAEALGLTFNPGELPDDSAVRLLREAGRIEGDCSLRIVLSGGFDDGRPGTIWMRSRPLAPAIEGPGAKVCARWFVSRDDRLLQAKTLNYWSRRLAFEEAKRLGFDENLSRDESGAILEGSRSNVFLVADGRIITPATSGSDRPDPSFLAGIMRAMVIERARRLGIEVLEARHASIDRLIAADECFLTNSGRGIVPVAEFTSGTTGSTSYRSPGPVTRTLMDELNAWLRSEDAR